MCVEKRPVLPVPEEEPSLPEETMFTGAVAEMTGLIPPGRPDEAQRDSYQDVLPWLPPHPGVSI